MLPANGNSIHELSKKSIQGWMPEEKVGFGCSALPGKQLSHKIVIFDCQSISTSSDESCVFPPFFDAG